MCDLTAAAAADDDDWGLALSQLKGSLFSETAAASLDSLWTADVHPVVGM